MKSKVIFAAGFVLTTLVLCSGKAVSNNESHGRYIHMVQPYVHVHDNRELGRYRHIPIPYNGGYGPYSGILNPYIHDANGNYDKYTTTTTKRPTTRPTTTTTTTTMRPRLFNYYEEGGWRIIRQEEEKTKHKYDYLYLTENGIYGEEQALLRKDAGTAAKGYYEYTGDDGELYRVNYMSDERGFIPEGDHIPTPPPIPEAIKQALEYVAKKQALHGMLQSGKYVHKPGPSYRKNMPSIDQKSYQKTTPVPLKKSNVPEYKFDQDQSTEQKGPIQVRLGSGISELFDQKSQKAFALKEGSEISEVSQRLQDDDSPTEAYGPFGVNNTDSSFYPSTIFGSSTKHPFNSDFKNNNTPSHTTLGLPQNVIDPLYTTLKPVQSSTPKPETEKAEQISRPIYDSQIEYDQPQTDLPQFDEGTQSESENIPQQPQNEDQLDQEVSTIDKQTTYPSTTFDEPDKNTVSSDQSSSAYPNQSDGQSLAKSQLVEELTEPTSQEEQISPDNVGVAAEVHETYEPASLLRDTDDDRNHNLDHMTNEENFEYATS